MKSFFKFWLTGWLVVLGLAASAITLMVSFNFAGKHFGPLGQAFVCAFYIITATSTLFTIDYSRFNSDIEDVTHIEL